MQTEGDIIEFPAPDAHDAPASFDDFFVDQHERLFRALYFVTGNRHDAEELMQDAFMKLWERWDRVDELDDTAAYLFRVALNGFRMRARRARVAARRVVALAPTSDPFADVELREDLRQLLRRLTPRQRTALVLTDVMGYGSDRAAEIMGIRPTTVRVLASQGRAALRAT